tara:strand:- start:128 stop:316 length:189 start_codon:yes stop_codon:yes gene_type:complete
MTIMLSGVHPVSTLIACPISFLSWHEVSINPLENQTSYGSDNHHPMALTKPEEYARALYLLN